jgi:hypothetical protein
LSTGFEHLAKSFLVGKKRPNQILKGPKIAVQISFSSKKPKLFGQTIRPNTKHVKAISLTALKVA